MDPMTAMFTTSQIPASHHNVISNQPEAATPKTAISRIIPIQIERGSASGAFMAQHQSQQNTRHESVERSVPINSLNDLKLHQEVNKVEENIRGYAKPKVGWNNIQYSVFINNPCDHHHLRYHQQQKNQRMEPPVVLRML